MSLSLLSVGVVVMGDHMQVKLFFFTVIFCSVKRHICTSRYFHSVSAHKTLESPSLNLVSFLNPRESNGKMNVLKETVLFQSNFHFASLDLYCRGNL